MASSPIAVSHAYASIGAAQVSFPVAASHAYANILEPDNVEDFIYDPSVLDTTLADGASITAFPTTTGADVATPVGGTIPLVKNVVNGKSVARFVAGRAFQTGLVTPTGESFTYMAVLSPTAINGLVQMIVGPATANQPAWYLTSGKQLFDSYGATNYITAQRQDAAISAGAFAVLTLRYVNGSRYKTAVCDRNASGSVYINAYNGTNGDPNTVWEEQAVSVSNPAILRMEPLTSTVVTTYTLTPRVGYNGTRGPKDFKLQGVDSLLGTWVDLDTRTNVTWPTAAAQTFSFTNTYAYRFYRLVVTALVGDTTVNLTDVQLNSIPARVPSWEVRVNGAPSGTGARDMALPFTFAASGSHQFGGSQFAGDLAYLRLVRGEVPLGDIAARETALLTAYGLTPAAKSNRPVAITTYAASTGTPGLLFDGVVGGSGNAWTAAGAPPQSVSMANPNSAAISGYAVTARTDAAGSAPTDMTLQGSNDNGSSWTTIDSKSGAAVAPWTNGMRQAFVVAGANAYGLHRLVVNGTQTGGATPPSFTELELLGQTTNPPPTPGPAGTVTFAIGMKLFGVSYAAGDTVPAAFSTTLLNSLVKRGRVSPTSSLVFKKAAKVNGTQYAVGAAFPGGTTPAVFRQLLRGRVIGK